MCYFVSIGARASARLLAQAFDEHADLDVAASPSCAPVARAFPVDDEVCLVTWHGCSCDLIAPRKPLTASVDSRTTKLVAAFQRSVIRVAKQLGSVRLLVHRHGEPCRLPAPSARLALTVHDFVSREHWFVEDVVMEVRGSEPSAPLERS